MSLPLFEWSPHLANHWWIYALFAAALAITIRAGHRRRIRWIQASERELARRVVERTRELQIEVEQRRATEEALNVSVAQTREAHQRLGFQVKCMPLAFIAWDLDHRVTEWNQAAERIFGWTLEEACGKQPYELIVPPPAQPGIQPLWQRLIDGAEGEEANYSVHQNITKDGRKLFCEWFNSPLRDEAGKVIRILSMAHDITERLQSQEQQRREAERTSFLLELHREAYRLTDRQIYDYVLEKAAGLTSSPVACLHRVHDDQATITLLAGRGSTSLDCARGDKAPSTISEAGAWADSARQKRPVIHTPDADPRFERHLSVPALDGEQVRLILGVGNKSEDYGEHDITQLQLVVNELQKVMSSRRAEESLRQSEARNRGMLQAIPDLLFVLNGEGVLLDYQAGRHMPLYREPGSFLGRRLDSVLPAEVAALGLRHLNETLRTGEVQAFDYELPGDPTPRSYCGRMSAIGGDQVLVLVQDVTERRQSEQERASLFAAIEQAGESVIITDGEGKIVYCNPAVERSTGYPRTEIIGRTPSISSSGKHDRDFYEKLWTTIKSGKVWTGHFTNRKRDGTLYEEDATISPIHDPAGRITGFVAVKRDVTQQTELEAQLRQAQKLETVGRLAGGIAHDFNNLLTVINGYSDLMQSRLPETGRLRDWLREIRKAGSMAADLTQQLLAFSRKRIIEPKPLELNEVINGTREMLRRIIGEDIDLETVLSPAAGWVLADPAHLHQVLMNLTVNARDAMPDGGKLTIETSRQDLDEDYCTTHPDFAPGCYVRLMVTDTGTGMNEETQRHIFEPFFTTKEKGVGTGLGLATVYGIVSQCSGAIRVYSQPGHGTRFEIFLPRLDGAAGLEEPAPAIALLGGSETVLVVEDQEDVRRLAVDALRSYGFRVLETASGGDALVLVQRHSGPIHLMLTDVVMPRMTGKELAERLQSIRPQMRVLFMSGYAEDVIAHHGVLEAGVDFIPKPFSPDGLAGKVREILSRGEGIAATTCGS